MIGPTDLHPSPTPHFKTFQVFLISCPKRPSSSTIQSHAPNVDMISLFLEREEERQMSSTKKKKKKKKI